jgi:hypothetical protein
MVSKKISELNLATTLDGTEVVPVVQNGETKKVSVANLIQDLRPYKVYTALLTQSGTDAPVATVLENTIGNISFSTGNAPGYYNINSNNLFNERTGLLLEPLSSINGNGYSQIENKNNSTLTISTLDIGAGPIDGLLINSMIEIRVYN